MLFVLVTTGCTFVIPTTPVETPDAGPMDAAHRRHDAGAPDARAPAHATTRVDVALELSATAVADRAFDPDAPETTSAFSFSVALVDTAGMPHEAQIFLHAEGAGNFTWHVLVDGEAASSPAGRELLVGHGRCDELGRFRATAVGTVDVAGAGSGQRIAWSLEGAPTAEGTWWLSRCGEAPFAVDAVVQDGRAAE